MKYLLKNIAGKNTNEKHALKTRDEIINTGASEFHVSLKFANTL